MSRLAPLSEEPINEDYDSNNCSSKSKTRCFKKWLQSHFPLVFLTKKSDLKLLLSVLACPLFPLSLSHIHSPLLQQPNPQVSSSAEYIIQHFRAATGCRKLEGKIKNVYATGKVAMTMETTFLQQVVEDESQMEGIPHGCSRIMNWHLHLEARKLLYAKAWQLSENLDVVVPTG